jgi:hypothetical protein
MFGSSSTTRIRCSRHYDWDVVTGLGEELEDPDDVLPDDCELVVDGELELVEDFVLFVDVAPAAVCVTGLVPCARPGSPPDTSWKKITAHATAKVVIEVARTRRRIRRTRNRRSAASRRAEARAFATDSVSGVDLFTGLLIHDSNCHRGAFLGGQEGLVVPGCARSPPPLGRRTRRLSISAQRWPASPPPTITTPGFTPSLLRLRALGGRRRADRACSHR